MEDYEKTPSFYNTKEVFQKFLAKTSYYVGLQNAMCKIARYCRPSNILELGAGTGETACRLAKENPDSYIVAVDIRENMVELGYASAQEDSLSNINFLKNEMVDYVRNQERLPELIMLLYAFHHIPDPNENKVNFLRLCKEKLPHNGKICIGEAFLPETPNEISQHSEILNCWSRRILDGYSSTFWEALEGISSEHVQRAKEIATFSFKNEKKAGDLVIERDNEYLVSMVWLTNTAVSLGFDIEIAEPCNSVGDAVVLLSSK